MTHTPSILVFDVNETLLDLTTIEPVFEQVFDDPTVMREWFAQLILYSEALTLSGIYTPFGDLAGGVLRMVGEIRGLAITEKDVDALKQHVASMPAHPDARPALERLRDAGFRLVTLTNSAPGPSPSPLERAGLADIFERSFSVDSVGRYKPAPETYRHVASELSVEMPDICMIACHVWDTIGAQAVGCAGALVTHSGNAILPVPGVPQPDLIAPDLTTLARMMDDAWARR